jgi:hypothetical protein
VFWLDGFVEGASGWVEEREVGNEGVEEGAGERVLWRETVADGEDAAIGDLGQLLAGWAVGGGDHDEIPPAVEMRTVVGDVTSFIISVYFCSSGIFNSADFSVAPARYPVHSASTGTSSGSLYPPAASPGSFSASMALNNACLISSSSGFGIVTLLIHILPLIPGSLKHNFWIFEIGCAGESTINDRMTPIMSAERRSQYLAGSENPKVYDRAVFPSLAPWGVLP